MDPACSMFNDQKQEDEEIEYEVLASVDKEELRSS